MYECEIRNIGLKASNSHGISGYRRYALYSIQEYGLNVGDFDSRVRFGFVMYKPGPYNTLGKVKIELKRLTPTNADRTTWGLSDIDPNLIKELLEPIEEWGLRQAFTIEDGVGYFNGYAHNTSSTSNSFCLIHSNLAVFLNTYGDALATLLLGKGNVKTLKDALEVNDLLTSVDAFSNEMKSDASWGTATYNKNFAQEEYNEYKKNLAKVEAEMNYIYARVQECLDVLSEYGIDEKDIEFT